jgi:hypothetical protein
MELFYFTEEAYEFVGLDGVNMNHLETSSWFDKRDLELKNSLSDSSDLSSNINSYTLPNSRMNRFRLDSTKKGKSLINLSTVEGVTFIRILWKEDAWLEYRSIQIDSYKESLSRVGTFSLDFWNEDVKSFSYKKLTDEGKKQIIKKYFMDFFMD